MEKVALLFVAAASLAFGSEPEVAALDNGLTVILQEMHYAPTVAVVITYSVGSRNETDEIAGISHFLEHMMFNGTPSMPGSMFLQLVQRSGGQANGGTGYDLTSYYLYMPAGSLEEALSIESDRMQNLLLDPDDIAQEIGVVMDEWRLGQDSPYSALFEAANLAYYGDAPYSRDISGTSEAIAAFDSTKVANYYRTWYVPGNAALAIVGDFEADSVMPLVEQYFSGIPGGEAPAVEFEEPDLLEGPVRLSVDYPAEADRLLIYFDGCSLDDPDLPALIALAGYLSQGRASWLQESLVSTGLATVAWAFAPGKAGETPFGITAQPAPGVSTDSLEKVICEEAFRLAEEPLDSERLGIVTGYFAGRQIMDENNPLRVATQLAANMTMTGDPMSNQELRERVIALTPEDVREVASRHFTPDRMLIAVLHAQPGGSGPEIPVGGVTEEAVPQVTDWDGLDLDPADLVPPDHSASEGTVRFELDNGLTLLVREDHSFPIVEMMVTVPMGDRRTSPENSGISRMTAETMLWGADGLSQADFHGRLMRVGGGIWLQPYPEFTLGDVYGPSESVDLYFESLADLLMRPTLDEGGFAQVRNLFLEEDRMQCEDPYSLANSHFDEVLLADGESREPDSATISGIDYGEMVDWYSTCVRPDGSVLAVVGDITPDDALDLAERYIGGWEAPQEPLPAADPLVFRTGPGMTRVEPIEGRMEAAVLFGCRAPAVEAPDYQAFKMMCSILGGGIGSRIGQNLRETQGLTYAVGSWVDGAGSSSALGSRFQTFYMTGAPFAARALEAAMGECARIAEEGVLEDEVLLKKFQGIGSHALGFDVYEELAMYLATREILGIPLDSDLTNLQAALALDPDDIREVAERYFTGEWFVSAAGGIDQALQPLE